ncbi:MAG: SPOR domain-containing protein [Butyrivibrio sp.]|nr:SPOR domain-containing protein [Butyrivibrio sp.]
MYNVVVGSFGIEYNAEIVNREARKKGLSTSIKAQEGKFSVEAGAFDEEEQAQSALGAVKGAGYVFAYIVRRGSEKDPALQQINQ